MADVMPVVISAPASQLSQLKGDLQTDSQALFGLHPWENREHELQLQAFIAKLQTKIQAELELEYTAANAVSKQIDEIKYSQFFAANWKHDLLILKYNLGKIQQRIDILIKIRDTCCLESELVYAITSEKLPLLVDSASIKRLQQDCLNALFELLQGKILTQLVAQNDIAQLRNLLSLQDGDGHPTYKNIIPLLQAAIAFGKTEVLIFLQNQIGKLPQIRSLVEFQQLILLALRTEFSNNDEWNTIAEEQSSLLVTIALGHLGTVRLLISSDFPVDVGGMSRKPDSFHINYEDMAVALKYGHLELFQLLLIACVQNYGYDGSNSVKQSEFIGHVVRNDYSLWAEVLECGYKNVLDYILLNMVLTDAAQTVDHMVLAELHKTPKLLAKICAIGKLEMLQWLLTRYPEQVLLQLADDKDACVAAAVTNGHTEVFRYLSRLRDEAGEQLFPIIRFAKALAENKFAVLITHMFVDTFSQEGDQLSLTNAFGMTVRFDFEADLRYFAIGLKYDLLSAANQQQFIALMAEIFANTQDLLPKEKVFLPLQAALDTYQARQAGAAAAAVQPQFTPAASATVIDVGQTGDMPQYPAAAASVRASTVLTPL